MSHLPDAEKSYWREFYPAASLYPKLSEDVEVDVAIVGAGITGMTTAHLLKKAGFTVAVVEKHTIGGGTTGRTTGKVTSQHNIHYDDLQTRLGLEVAGIYGQANQAAIEKIEQIIREEAIDCDWQRDDNYVYTADDKRVDQFKKEAAIAVRLGLPASFETDIPLPFAIKGAVKFAHQAKINTQKYLLGLAQFVHGNGSYIFENSTAIGIREGSPGRIKTPRGRVYAQHIVIASSVPTLPLIARAHYSIHEYPSESYLIAGEPDSNVTGMYISPDKHHYSILPVTAGGKNMLLVGGEGHLWGLRGNRKARFERLAHYAELHFRITTVTNKWSDRDYLAYDGVPLIGKLYPWSKKLYVGTAYKKWGLTNGTVAAMVLSDMICSNPNPWAKIFTPRRPTLRNALVKRSE